MNLFDLTRSFLQAQGAQVQERERNFLVAEKPGLGGEVDRTCVWVLTRELRQSRNSLLAGC